MEDLLDKILSSRRFHGRFGRVVSFPPREARTEEIPGLPGGLKRYLDDKGISNLFQHQRKMFDIVSAGNNAVISTPTASGKTLSFNLPVISRLLEKEGATAMYVYPLKALSNDQLSVLKEIDSFCSGRLLPAIYDGDTPQGKRPGIRENSRIILTNPYELHHVLPYHYKWERFLRGLEFMVIDEAHKYTGVFGSNTAFLMMRLKRILDYYGARPRFILSSASIGNPLEFARSLIGEDFESVEEDSSPSPGRFMIPIRGGDEERSALPDIRDLMIILAGLGLQTICFTGSRKLSELLPAMIREKQSGLNVVSYRAGYLPAERREIEDGIRKREVMAVVSTPALELGIDIGGLDAVVTAGFPRSLSSLFQQGGRCGRRGRAGLVFYIAFEDVIDRYFFDHPELIENPVFEDCAISTENEHIASGHILCAASELPIRESKERSGIASHAGLIADFVESGLLGRTEDGVIFTGTGRPHEAVSLDGTGSGGIALLCEGKLIETMTREQAWREAYDGAVLLHQGVRHIVTRRDIGNSIIEVERRDVDFYTDMMKEEKITGFDGRVSRGSGATSLVFGSVSVVENAIARP
ncbi:MAG: DEAD/DEAH box helicase, partial [Deltaproteobacteria bacterium]|nr:DEAD/DEAH box helicase [Deltaproteobacteria bacterium]